MSSADTYAGNERPVVTLLTDFGTDDPFVGLCHLAVLAEAPEAHVVDLGHAVRPQHVVQGAARLADAVAHTRMPAVHVAVVDPGVGSSRRALLVRAGEQHLVGPDNGLLIEAAERLGGIDAAWELPVPAAASSTFHGRDVFAPAAGRIAAGLTPATLGRPVDPAGLVRLEPATPEVAAGRFAATIRDVDRYGNVQLAAGGDDLERAGFGLAVSAGGGAAPRGEAKSPQGEAAQRSMWVRADERLARAERVQTFADLAPGRVGVLVDSFGWAAVVVAGGSAAERFAADLGETIEIVAA